MMLLLLFSTLVFAAPTSSPPSAMEAKKLEETIKKERLQFVQRETERLDVLGELDQLNVKQNEVRTRIDAIVQNHQELTMALENLNMELARQKELEAVEKKRLSTLLKFAYRIRRQGTLRFLISGESLTAMVGRVRILHHTLKTHALLSHELSQRKISLEKGEKKLSDSKQKIQDLLAELKDQELLLGQFLNKKHHVLSSLNKKQSHFQALVKQHQRISAELSSLFENFESSREKGVENTGDHSSLLLPVEFGKIVKNFGKQIHQKFKTVTWQKGIEIEAEHDAPVAAVLPGTIEYSGWVRGLGNTMILHHGSGFYTLYAHLFRLLKTPSTAVAKGETIATVGDTGSSEKSSLYFEIRENGKAVDPLNFFSAQALHQLN